MLENINARPGVEERYQSACSTSTLKVTAERSGPGDVLIASAWSDASIGGALMRLHTAWLKVKPRSFTDADVARHAGQLPQKRGKLDVGRARRELTDAYVLAVRQTADVLHGRGPIVRHLSEWAIEKGMDAELVGPCLTFWLAPQCPICYARSHQRMADAPILGAKCGSCGGTGRRAAPLGGGRILDRIEHTISKWRSDTRARLHGR